MGGHAERSDGGRQYIVILFPSAESHRQFGLKSVPPEIDHAKRRHILLYHEHCILLCFSYARHADARKVPDRSFSWVNPLLIWTGKFSLLSTPHPHILSAMSQAAPPQPAEHTSMQLDESAVDVDAQEAAAAAAAATLAALPQAAASAAAGTGQRTRAVGAFPHVPPRRGLTNRRLCDPCVALCACPDVIGCERPFRAAATEQADVRWRLRTASLAMQGKAAQAGRRIHLPAVLRP